MGKCLKDVLFMNYNATVCDSTEQALRDSKNS